MRVMRSTTRGVTVRLASILCARLESGRPARRVEPHTDWAIDMDAKTGEEQLLAICLSSFRACASGSCFRYGGE